MRAGFPSVILTVADLPPLPYSSRPPNKPLDRSADHATFAAMTDSSVPHFTKLRAIYASFYSKDLYRDVSSRWEGLGFSYLFLLVALIITPAIVILISMIDRTLFGDAFNPHINRMATEIIEQLPTLEWDENQMRVIDGEEVKTITISMEERELPIIRLDADGSAEELIGSEHFMMLTRDALHFQKMGGEVESKPWEEIITQDGFVLDNAVARSLADEGIQWLTQNRTSLYLTFGIFFWAFTVLAFYLYRIIEALVIAMFGLLIQRPLGEDLDYAQLVRIAAVAMTPAIIIDIALLAAGLGGISFIMFMLVSLGYLGFGVNAQRET